MVWGGEKGAKSFKKGGGWKECMKVTIFGFDVVEEKERRKKRDMLGCGPRVFFVEEVYNTIVMVQFFFLLNR